MHGCNDGSGQLERHEPAGAGGEARSPSYNTCNRVGSLQPTPLVACGPYILNICIVQCISFSNHGHLLDHLTTHVTLSLGWQCGSSMQSLRPALVLWYRLFLLSAKLEMVSIPACRGLHWVCKSLLGVWPGFKLLRCWPPPEQRVWEQLHGSIAKLEALNLRASRRVSWHGANLHANATSRTAGGPETQGHLPEETRHGRKSCLCMHFCVA